MFVSCISNEFVLFFSINVYIGKNKIIKLFSNRLDLLIYMNYKKVLLLFKLYLFNYALYIYTLFQLFLFLLFVEEYLLFYVFD